MTIPELEKQGYRFNVFHHKNEIEVRVSLKSSAPVSIRSEHVGSCAAAYRTDAMEMARQRAAIDFVTRRLSA